MSFLTAKSFVFNGINSEDFNVIIAWIDSPDPNTETNGLNREVNKSTINKMRTKANVYGSNNTDVITLSFSIVRINGTEITRDESIRINQWLTSSPLPQILRFNDNDSYMLHYYAICTQIKDVVIGGKLVGKDLTFETNSTFAFMKKFEKSFDVTDTQNFYINNTADTYDGIYYPVITISTSSEIIIIENVTDMKSVTFNMVNIISDDSANKTIKINCQDMTIVDNNDKLVSISKLGWDENYKSYVSATNKYMNNIYWFRLLQGMNEIKITGDCTFKIECEYPRKAGCL